MRYLTIFALFSCLIPLSLQAAEYRGLYEAEVEVASQDNEARIDGMGRAMAAVLLKVSGDGRVNEDPLLAEAMQQPARYVQQYRYRSEAIPPEKQQPVPGGAPMSQRTLLNVRFDQRSIDELLQQSGFNIWGDARPSTLIWLGVEDGGRRVLVGDNDGGLVRELIDNEAARRGLPIKLPLLDLTDRGKVRPVDVWGEFVETIREASRRYDAQAILTGRLYPVSSSLWELRWTLDYHGELIRGQSQSAQVAPLIAEAIDRVADLFASQFAQVSLDGRGEMRMRVEGVASLRDYRRTVDYLSGINGVKQVVVETLTPESLDLRIATEGGAEKVRQIIALGNTLVRVEAPLTGASRPLDPVPLLGSGKSAGDAPSGGSAAEGRRTKVAEPPQPELVYRLLP